MKNYINIYEDKLIGAFFTFCLIVMILCTVLLLNINIKIDNIKIKKIETEAKEKTIMCAKKQLHCYNENRKLTEKEIMKTCGDIDFCENP
jgi:Na+-transporting NADH:ubiquinone oxidoreductase subunit NqrF